MCDWGWTSSVCGERVRESYSSRHPWGETSNQLASTCLDLFMWEHRSVSIKKDPFFFLEENFVRQLSAAASPSAPLEVKTLLTLLTALIHQRRQVAFCVRQRSRPGTRCPTSKHREEYRFWSWVEPPVWSVKTNKGSSRDVRCGAVPVKDDSQAGLWGVFERLPAVQVRDSNHYNDCEATRCP